MSVRVISAPLVRGARLLRWLGPWTPDATVPTKIVQREVSTGGERPMRAWVWRRADEAPSGSLLLVPGLHYLGPSDPRFDRFARVLARSGLLVLSPFLPDFERLWVGRDLAHDTSRALDLLLAQPDRPAGRPGVFSISFGSMPALRLAAARGDELASLIVFGGFADFRTTLRFALAGDGVRANDPLNAPVVFINLIEHLGVPDAADRDALCAAWRRQCERTWGKEENKRESFYVPIAHELAATLAPELRELFLVGCRAAPGTEACALAAVERAGTAFDWIDPRPHLGALKCPVTLVHGRDDDVIPHEESAALFDALPSHTPKQRHLTGLYAHTRSATGPSPRVADAVRELTAMAAILSAIARSSRS